MGAGVYRIDMLQAQRVPEANVLVRSASACREETPMERAPIDRFHRGLVLTKLGKRLWLMTCLAHIPYHQLVVVAAGSKHFVVVGTPAEPTYFLPMTIQVLDGALWCSNIVYAYAFIFASTCNEATTPGTG